MMRRREKGLVSSPVSWINLAVSYGTLFLLSLGSFLFLLMNQSNVYDSTIASYRRLVKTEGAKNPLKVIIRMLLQVEKGKTGEILGEAKGWMPWAEPMKTIKNSMREAQVVNPDIAGAELKNIHADESFFSKY